MNYVMGALLVATLLFLYYHQPWEPKTSEPDMGGERPPPKPIDPDPKDFVVVKKDVLPP